jgi:hypothetical protein
MGDPPLSSHSEFENLRAWMQQKGLNTLWDISD